MFEVLIRFKGLTDLEIQLVKDPDRTKAPPLRNLSIARELTLASFGICGEVQDRCERPRKRRKLEYGIVLRVSGGGGEGRK